MSTELTDAECDAFRALPLDFNGMVRAIYAAGAARSADTSDAKRWRWWRQKYRALTTMGCARVAGLDLSRAFVQSPEQMDAVTDAAIEAAEPPPAAPGGPAGARRPDENSPSGPSDRALNTQPEAVDHDRGSS